MSIERRFKSMTDAERQAFLDDIDKDIGLSRKERAMLMDILCGNKNTKKYEYAKCGHCKKRFHLDWDKMCKGTQGKCKICNKPCCENCTGEPYHRVQHKLLRELVEKELAKKPYLVAEILAKRRAKKGRARKK